MTTDAPHPLAKPDRPVRVLGLDLRVSLQGYLSADTLREALLRARAAGAVVLWLRSVEQSAGSPWPQRVASAVADFAPDIVLVERVWRADVVQAARLAVPAATWVRLASGAEMPLDGLLDGVVDGGAISHRIHNGVWPARSVAATPAALRQQRAERAPPAGVLEPVDVEGLEGERLLQRPSIRGPVEGCPFLLDARRNLAYAQVDLTGGVQTRGCAYCLDNTGVYAAPKEADMVASWVGQLEVLRAHDPALSEVLLSDERPHPYLPALMRALAERPHLFGLTLLWKSRVDWLLEFAGTAIAQACQLAPLSRTTLDLYLIGIENFADSELTRMNKGVTAAENRSALQVVEQLGERFSPWFVWQRSRAHGIILFSPWTSPEELQINAEQMAAVGFERYRLGALRTRMRLYPGLPLYAKAQQEGLLAADFAAGRDRAEEQGYNASVPWRFAHAGTAAIWRLCDVLGPALAPGQPEHAVLREAVRWGVWLADLPPTQTVLPWLAWQRAGSKPAPTGAAVPDGELAAVLAGSTPYVVRALPGQTEVLAAAYKALGLAVLVQNGRLAVARNQATLPTAIPLTVSALDLHVWALVDPAAQELPLRFALTRTGLMANLQAEGGWWPALRLDPQPAGGLQLQPMWPNPAQYSDAERRREQLQAVLPLLGEALTPEALVPPAGSDRWPECALWPLPALQVAQTPVDTSPLAAQGTLWQTQLRWHTPNQTEPLTLRVSAWPTQPESQAVARTDHRWLAHGDLGLVPGPVAAQLLRELAAWWTACERGLL
jgi:hypothetical protein